MPYETLKTKPNEIFTDEVSIQLDEFAPLPVIPVQLDPLSKVNFQNEASIPYTTTAPSGTPIGRKEAIYFDATNYWLYVYANGAWRRVQLTTV